MRQLFYFKIIIQLSTFSYPLKVGGALRHTPASI